MATHYWPYTCVTCEYYICSGYGRGGGYTGYPNYGYGYGAAQQQQQQSQQYGYGESHTQESKKTQIGSN